MTNYKALPSIVNEFGFWYFKVGSRFMNAIYYNGELIYARDFKTSGNNDNNDNEFVEPDDYQFMEMMEKQN